MTFSINFASKLLEDYQLCCQVILKPASKIGDEV